MVLLGPPKQTGIGTGTWGPTDLAARTRTAAVAAAARGRRKFGVLARKGWAATVGVAR